ncbi:MAG: hypothetical protein JEY99_01980 [Spirochaetales bacterium]|nr:hypothetical protein [Spirochaetales bacterium]
MNLIIIVAFLIAIFFYLLIPAGGAFYVRRRWRLFRKSVIDSSSLPEVSYAKLKNVSDGYAGEFRMLGSLQAIQGDDSVWISNRAISLRVQLTGVDVYTLPHSALIGKGRNISIRENLTDEIPVRMPWNRFSSLPEGTRLLVSGSLYREKGQLLFKTSRETPLLVLIYDGSENTILIRTIWAGRQQNEYINDFTPGSMAAGGVILLLLTYLSTRLTGADFYSWLIFTMALSPLFAILPPGLGLFELYLIFWRRGRRYRAERDLVLLSLRYWPGVDSLSYCSDIRLHGSQTYGYRLLESGRIAIEQVNGGRLINTGFLDNDTVMDSPVFVFGIVGDEAGQELFPPSKDLMISPLIIPGDPSVLFKICSKKARIMEILAGLSLLAGFALNLFLFLLILRYIIY